MRIEIYKYPIILLVGIFMSSVSQVLLKKATIKEYDHVWKEYINPTVIAAYLIFFATTFTSIYAYKGIPLSMGAVLETTSYFYVTFWGVKVFKEKISYKKIIALLFIFLGVMFYSVWG